MKYVVAADASSLDAEVHKRFGHAGFYLVVDSETMTFKSIPGVGSDEPSYEPERFAGMGAERIIAGNFGPGNFYKYSQAGWQMFQCRKMTVREAVTKVDSGSLRPLTEPSTNRSIHAAGGPGAGRGGGGGFGGGRGPGYRRGAGGRGDRAGSGGGRGQ